MLEPGDRTVYTEALTPPPGMRFDFAVGATYSLDLDVLLAVPLQLALAASEGGSDLMRDLVTLYESLQRVASRLRVFVQSGGMHAPSTSHLLYGLLEPVVVEVDAPRGGVFHPKLWALRFLDDANQPFYRLVVSSRNITADQSWDLGLTLEGRPGYFPRPANAGLAKLVRSLPGLSSAGQDQQIEDLAGEIESVEWELPPGFSEARFFALGLDADTWRPRAGDSLVVISPFVSDKALRRLADTSAKPLALISRAESLEELDGKLPFRELYCLHEAAETDDSEDAAETVEIGLHAKAYVVKSGKNVYVTLGSANATDAALVARNNVELLVELKGGAPQLGGPARLLDTDIKGSFGQLLMPWRPGDARPVDVEAREREELLEAGRRELSKAGLGLSCRKVEGEWRSMLAAARKLTLDGLDAVSAWPVTLKRERAVDASALRSGGKVQFPIQAVASLTSLIAFELRIGEDTVSFTLNLPVEGMPEDRDGAILRHVVSDKDGFLRYLLLLLAGIGDGADVAAVARALSSTGFAKFHEASDDFPLLEEMIRAFCRDNQRLKRVKRLVEELCRDRGRHGSDAEGLPRVLAGFRASAW